MEEISGYQKIIDGAKQITQNWKPKIDIDPGWGMVKLGDVCENTKLGAVISKGEQGKGNYKYLKMDSINDGFFDYSKSVFVEYSPNKDDFLQIGDFIYNTRNAPNLVGKCAVFNSDSQYLYNNNLLRIRFNKSINPFFVGYIMNSDFGKKETGKIISGTTSVAAIYQKEYLAIQIPLPPLPIQNEIVGLIEHERQLVDSAKQLIAIYEAKIKSVIAKVWADVEG